MLPTEYNKIHQNHGMAMVYQEDWKAFDFKGDVKKLVKAYRSFKISEAKVIQLKDGKLGMKESYKKMLTKHTIFKHFNHIVVPLKSCIKDVKAADVKKMKGRWELSKTLFQARLQIKVKK